MPHPDVCLVDVFLDQHELWSLGERQRWYRLQPGLAALPPAELPLERGDDLTLLEVP